MFSRSGTELARYVYVPTAAVYAAGQTDFYRPTAASGPAAVRFEVLASGAVRAGPGPGVGRLHEPLGRWHEQAFAGAYVVPYNPPPVVLGGPVGHAPGSVMPGYFLARLPAGAPLPTAAERRYTFASEADAVVPSSWGSVGWDSGVWAAPGLELTFPPGRRLVVGADLTARRVTLTEATMGQRWGGVVVRAPGRLDFAGVTVEKALVGVEVRSTGGTAGNVLTDVRLNGNGVGLLADFVTSVCPVLGGPCVVQRSGFTLAESCVTNSVFDDDLGLQGYGVWARHTDGTIVRSTVGAYAAPAVGANAAYGLFLDNADLDADRLRLQGNGAAPSSSFRDGVNVRPNGRLALSDLPLALGRNLLTSNVASAATLFVEDDGYATIGVGGSNTEVRNHLAHASSSGVIISNNNDPTDDDFVLLARRTHWGPGGNPPGAPPPAPSCPQGRWIR